MKASDKEILYHFFEETRSWIQEARMPNQSVPAFTDDNEEPTINASQPAITVPDSRNSIATVANTTDTNSAPLITTGSFEEMRRQLQKSDSATTGDPSELAKIYAEIRNCKKCTLCMYRKNVVPGMGQLHPAVLIVGEGPGADEDEQGLPFVGKAGQLLDNMLKAIGISRNTNCYIGNTVKCRPPKNRTPYPDEINACSGFLAEQIRILKPKAILAMGRTAAQALLETESSITRMHGNVFGYSKDRSIPVVVTYHPSALLRDETLKRPAWNDLKIFRSLIDREFPGLLQNGQL